MRIKAEAATNIHCSEGGITTLLQRKVFRFERGKILDASKGWALFVRGIYEVSICKKGKVPPFTPGMHAWPMFTRMSV